MINAKSDIKFIILNLKALLKFKIVCFFSFLFKGHMIRKKKIDNYFNLHEVKKLHLGATFKIKGFLNSQIMGDIPIDITKRLPFNDQTIDLIYSSHLIEHIHRKEIIFFLEESYRILKPGGKHIISTPSLTKVIDVCYGKNYLSKKILYDHGNKFHDDGFYSTAHQMNLLMRGFGHRFILDHDFIKVAGKKIGYRNITILKNSDFGDKQISQYIKNRKSQRWSIETETFSLSK